MNPTSHGLPDTSTSQVNSFVFRPRHSFRFRTIGNSRIMNALSDELIPVLKQYGLQDSQLTPLTAGLINRSFLVTNAVSGKFILQKINPMFNSTIIDDIETVTRHIEKKGIPTPRLAHTTDNRLYAEINNERWRIYNFIPGKIFESTSKPQIASEAGKILASFHMALLDLDYQFKYVRHGVHDTKKHMDNLRNSLKTQTDHPRFNNILPLGEMILGACNELPVTGKTPERKVHGDPKITNILFNEKEQALCLIDFDTLSNMPLPLELGDAFRSWCNPFGEDIEDTLFSMDLFKAALEGYSGAGRDFILKEEWRCLVDGTLTIFVELAARFCADALNESYFSWDEKNFNSHSEHNEIRARGQINAAMSLKKQYKQAQEIVNSIFQ